MANKKKGIVIAAVVIAVAAVAVTVLMPYIRSGLDGVAAAKFERQDLSGVDSVRIIADCAKVDGVADSPAGVKEAARLGADGVVVDLCFREDGTPVICDDYSVAKDAPGLETLFKQLNTEGFSELRIYLHIVQLSGLDELNRLASEYNMSGRLYLTGIDADRYGMITADDTSVPFLLDYTPTQQDLKDAENGTAAVPDCVKEYGAAGVIVPYDAAGEALISAYNDLGLTVVYSGLSGATEVCEALLDGAQNIYVDDARSVRRLLDRWIEKMRERNSSSVEESINNLSTTNK